MTLLVQRLRGGESSHIQRNPVERTSAWTIRVSTGAGPGISPKTGSEHQRPVARVERSAAAISRTIRPEPQPQARRAVSRAPARAAEAARTIEQYEIKTGNGVSR